VFFLTEKLDASLQADESFGSSIDCVGTKILVGSPYYKNSATNSTQGLARLFTASQDAVSWITLTTQQPLIDLRKIKKIELYDNVRNIKIQDVDYVNAAAGKILNIAEQEIKFKTPYDPAIYSIGTDEVVVDTSVNWLEKNVGKLWWNTGTAKFQYAEQNDAAYRLGAWNQLVSGASIDVFEWVETVLLPSEWAALADTNLGLTQGISGQPLYPNDDVYSVKQFFSTYTGTVSETYYYYWVKNKAVVPVSMSDRTRSAAEVAGLIANPNGSGVAYVAFIDTDKFVTYNFDSVIPSDTALLNFQLRNNLESQVPVHSEYQLLTEAVADSLPSMKLENKWIDSLVGSDVAGNRVPDTDLSAKQKYGINYRPRQTMFVDRVLALKITIEYINNILEKEMFADTIDFTNLNKVDSEPSAVLNIFDVTVDNDQDLQTVGTVRIKQAILRGNLINGELDTIDIIDPGFGYKPKAAILGTSPQLYEGPPITISGDGIKASAVCRIDGQGRIAQVILTNRGKKYSTINVQVRYFSVLVKNDATLNNFWSIYSWDNIRRVFFRSQSQAYDTTRYWSRINWTKSGYDSNLRIIREYHSIYDEIDTKVSVGDIIKIKEYTSGGWAVFEKIADTGETFLDRYMIISRENGTIKLDSSLYDTTITGVGFDNTQSFDTTIYDIENANELRNIFAAVKNDIFVGDYAVEWNKLFFTSIRQVLSEQQYVDWVFKTSFLNAIHNVGSFEQKINYKNDNLVSFQDYIDEVKPYRTKVREYVSRYDTLENYAQSTADFDLPPTYSVIDGAVVPITSTRSELDVYPWKWWTDNRGYSVTAIQLYVNGTQYSNPPRVLIEGDGTGATAQAFIANGKVSGIRMLTTGTGYTKAPTVTLVGGNPTTAVQAKAAAVIGDTKVRTFDVSIKFDRLNTVGIYQSLSQTQTFTASGTTAVFVLGYAPTRDKTKISVVKNNQVVLSSEYTVNLYYQTTDSYSLLRGKLIFNQAPDLGDTIIVTYDKNTTLLDAVNRINQSYTPNSGMVGKELNQLMTGVDFGGVQIQGTTFDVTGGWDALPWFTDNWDSVETSSDYYFIVDGIRSFVDSTAIYLKNEIVEVNGILYKALKDSVDTVGNIIIPGISEEWQLFWEIFTVRLPYVPAAGQQLNVYIKRKNTNVTVRVDDEFYAANNDSSTGVNPSAEMPTFVGNGVTDGIQIGQYLLVNNEDTLIFRPIESDGSVSITDDNILDTNLSGGSLSAISGAYVTATGTTAEEIAITGGKFIEPDHVPAPEENVPGQVLESVSIKVYNNSVPSDAPLQSKITVADGVDTNYAIGQTVLESKSVFVYVNNVPKILNTDYVIDQQDQTVQFVTAPADGLVVEILSIGIGGLGILDYQTYTADGNTGLFLTNANYDNTSQVFVTVNGAAVDVGFRNSTDVVDAVGRTLIDFGIFPLAGDVIKIVCFETAADTDSAGISIVQVNSQTVYFEGSTRSFDIDGFTELSRESAVGSMIVEVNDTVLKGPDTVFAVYDGTNNVFILGQDPLEAGGSILPSNINVYINGTLKTYVTDWVFDGPTKVLTVSAAALSLGDNIKIENDIRSEYSIQGSSLIIDSTVNLNYTGDSTSSKIDITWFNEYPSLDIIADQTTGGKVQYQLSRPPLSASYVWVYKNGQRLRQEKDYYVSLPRAVVYLKTASTLNDDIKILNFSRNAFSLPVAYEIHKDMLNVYHYNRYAKGTVKLQRILNYYDSEIQVDDATGLSDPISSRNIPGVISIAGERIEYMTKTGNTLGQLRRGSQGTAIADAYAVGTAVVDVGYSEIIPYNENQERTDFVSDGSTQLIGPLTYVPSVGVRSTWYRDSIPSTYGPCDQIEVFAGGRRLRKDPQSVWVEDNGAYSPEADQLQEAEFSVDGSAAFIRLTTTLPAGTRVSVLRRQGKTWYERGDITASKGIPLPDNDTAIARFISEKTTAIPE
jgi:hypothetical protein